MRRHVQVEGVRRWAGEHIIDLQAEPFKVIDAFFEEYGNCVIKGCGVLDWGDGTYHVEPGLVGLQGTDPEGNPTFKVAPFAGVTDVALPAYFVLRFETVEREYVDEKMHPIYYEYRTDLVTEKPTNEPYLEITPSGAACFLDVTGVTHKLDQDGEGKDVTVSFEEAKERENVESGDTLSKLLGKVRKWFAGLQAVAFSGKTADLTDDAEHRMVTDTEKARWNDTYTQEETNNKDTAALRIAKEYADNQVTNLGNDVYRKAEVYTKQESDAQHEGNLAAAKQFVVDRIAELIDGSPAALDTLYEIAAALNNDPNFATTIMALLNGKADSVHKHAATEIIEDERHRFISDQELKKLSTLSNSTITNGDKASFDEYTQTGRYYVYNVSGGPAGINMGRYFVLLEVEVLPNGAIYQTVKSAATGNNGIFEIYMRCFCSDRLGVVTAWSRWYRIFSETEIITTAPITTPAPETGCTTPALGSGNTDQTPESGDITTPIPPTTPAITTPAPESEDANQAPEEFEVIITPMPPDLLL